MTTAVRDRTRTFGALILALGACAAAACGSVKNPATDAAVNFTDAAVDAAPPVVDAAVDAAPPVVDAGPTRAADLVNGSARVRSNTYTLDLEIGHTFSPTRSTGATHQLDVKPAVSP